MMLCPGGDMQFAKSHTTDQQACDGTPLLCNDCYEEQLEADVYLAEACNVIYGRNLITASDIYIEPLNPLEVF